MPGHDDGEALETAGVDSAYDFDRRWQQHCPWVNRSELLEEPLHGDIPAFAQEIEDDEWDEDGANVHKSDTCAVAGGTHTLDDCE